MKAIKITTDNKVSIVATDGSFGSNPEKLLEEQNTSCLEYVKPRYGIRNTVLAVDESGMLKCMPINEAASLMYGVQHHGNPIVGNVLVLSISPEPDYVPFSDEEAKKTEEELLEKFPFLERA
jgi:hypothetical protein